MKKIIILVLILIQCCLSISLLGQKKLYSNSIDLTPFIGIWEYRTENEVFKITLKEGKVDDSFIQHDCLIGGYYYQKNGNVVAQHSDPAVKTYSYSSDEIKIMAYNSSSFIDVSKLDPSHLHLLFIDDQKEGKNSSLESSITLLSPTTIKWTLKEEEQIYITDKQGSYKDGFKPKPEGFSVPTNVVLTKVE